ncbi:MAG: epoxyqueuosine reductase QueH [bacterium]|nr:epoxyqueuosine reductase QueH [bacterium]
MKRKNLKKNILLHICCAPDSTTAVENLKEKGYEVIGYYYNPNMDSPEEDIKRFNDTVKVSKEMNFELIGDYGDIKDRDEWMNEVKNLGNLDEGGTRCFYCFRFRLRKTAVKAKEIGTDLFTTTLTVSPHKNASLINCMGEEIARENEIEYFNANFKKNNGFKKSLEYSRKFKLYRQNYCGCIFSRRNGLSE